MIFSKSITFTAMAMVICLTIATAGAEGLSSENQVPLAAAANELATPAASVDQNAWSLVENALGWLGVPYKRGGKSADRGFDCSGFVGAVYAKTFGLILPPSALLISKIGQPITFAELKIGDLIFFNTLRRPFSHVGIYLGEGRFIHACSTGKQIKVDTLDQYYTKRIDGFRRINLS